MANLSKSYAHDASKNKPKPRVRYWNGERRLEKAPLGVTERWVDRQGNVVNHQLRKAGDVPDQGIVDRSRAEKRREGWIEHHLCPLLSGAIQNPKVEADLGERPSELLNACAKAPKTAIQTARGWELQCGCPHVEWLIKHRVERTAAEREMKRGARSPNPGEVQAEMLKETKRANDALIETVKSLAKPEKTREPREQREQTRSKD